MIKHIKKVANKFGVDLVKYRTKTAPLSFLREYAIKTVIDVGANVGQFASEIRAVLPEAQIHSFEPTKDCFTKLNMAFKNDRHFKSYNFALGDNNGTSVIHHNDYAPSSSILENTALLEEAFPFTRSASDETITIKTLDSVFSGKDLTKNILLKLDVQGFEDKVLRGGINFLDKVNVVLSETSFFTLYKNQPLFGDIYAILKQKGFEYRGSLQSKRHPKTGEVLFEDSIFVRETN